MPSDDSTSHVSRDEQDNSRVIAAMKSLLGRQEHPEIETATFSGELEIEYTLIEETEEEAREWLLDTLEFDGDQIDVTIRELEREPDD